MEVFTMHCRKNWEKSPRAQKELKYFPLSIPKQKEKPIFEAGDWKTLKLENSQFLQNALAVGLTLNHTLINEAWGATHDDIRFMAIADYTP